MTSQQAEGSGRSVKDFSFFCEGDTDPTLNKKICTLIDADQQYIVYLDDEPAVQWSMTEEYGKMPPRFSDVANRTGRLETLAHGILRQQQSKPFERLLGEAMSRVIGDKDPDKAFESLQNAEDYLQARSIENARIWYISGAFITASILAITAISIWICRPAVQNTLGAVGFEVLLGSCAGGIGALLWIVSRTKSIQVDGAAGPRIHITESVARVMTGSIGALLAALAIEAKLLFGFATSGAQRLSALLVACLIAGASERFIPNLIKKVEGSITASHPEKVRKRTKDPVEN